MASFLAILIFPFLFLLGFGVLLARFELDPPPVPADPRTAGHTDVLLIDPEDGIRRGAIAFDYAGKFAKDPRLPDRVKAIEEAIPAAVAHVAARLGRGDRPPPAFTVRFRDEEQMRLPIRMSVFQELRGTEFRPLIVVGVDDLLDGDFDRVLSLRHEIAHCFHLAALGEPFYRLPSWVKEGLADWASGEGPVHVEGLVRRYGPLRPEAGVDPFVDGLEWRTDGDDYPEAYLAFAMVEEEFGPEASRRLVEELLTHTSYRVAVRRATGLDFPVFEMRARGFARREIERAFLKGVPATRPSPGTATPGSK